jgi:LmbE family N-acetylglucosaminyl deacetylase
VFLPSSAPRRGRTRRAELRYLGSAAHRFDATSETKRAVAEVVADVKPDVAFLMWPHDRHHDHEVASVLSNLALRHGDRVWDKGLVPVPKRIYAYDNGPRHTIGFEPNTYVDVTPEWPAAADWLGRFMALTRGQPYGRATPDGAVRAKEALDRHRSTPSRDALPGRGRRPFRCERGASASS